jgi:deazaflavin-dependent oxidoreductase (nitroreductase family)
MLYGATAGRLGLRPPRPGVAGMLRLRTIGRTSGLERTAILCYITDGSALVTLAMNGWGEAEPQWWRNLQANPVATVDTVTGPRHVRARPAAGEERERLWNGIRDTKGWATDLDDMAALRSRQTAVVILDRQAA